MASYRHATRGAPPLSWKLPLSLFSFGTVCIIGSLVLASHRAHPYLISDSGGLGILLYILGIVSLVVLPFSSLATKHRGTVVTGAVPCTTRLRYQALLLIDSKADPAVTQAFARDVLLSLNRCPLHHPDQKLRHPSICAHCTAHGHQKPDERNSNPTPGETHE